jgi:protein-disulfide isomerase
MSLTDVLFRGNRPPARRPIFHDEAIRADLSGKEEREVLANLTLQLWERLQEGFRGDEREVEAANIAELAVSLQERLAALPPAQQGPRMAELGKLPEFAAAAGVARARYDACIASKPGEEKLLAIRKDAVQNHGLTGTPSFLINGKMQADTFDWAALEPQLAAALKATGTK